MLKIGVVLILNQFNIVFNGENFGTKYSGLKIEVVLILRWSLSQVPLYIYGLYRFENGIKGADPGGPKFSEHLHPFYT